MDDSKELEKQAAIATMQYINNVEGLCRFLNETCKPQYTGTLPRVVWMQNLRAKIRTEIINARLQSSLRKMYDAVTAYNDSIFKED